ncbi:hypothetical protein ABMA32_09790 [Mesorhizobium sp. VNQ89]|uniref:hypothetical protein n=1 Tax=Mesorhizobium quangtriensis TaxID=3157709 RepID=UPI0032B70BD0
MRTVFKLAAMTGLAALASGCMTESKRQADGLTHGAGDAMASNTVMQMVDPWQYGVQDTDLLVPANRAAASAADTSANSKQSQTSSSSGSE